MDLQEVRLRKLMKTYGKTLILPYDQGLEHGPEDFFHAYFSQDPLHVLAIARKARYNAVVFHVGNARRYFDKMYGDISLILKVNGKTNIPDDDEPLSPVTASVEDALMLGACAIGYTLYVGSPRQDEDFEQFAAIREEAHRAGLPVIVWSYPRGKAIDDKGGKNSLYAIEYAARTAAELGADMIKLNVPDLKKHPSIPEPYRSFDTDLATAVRRVIAAACGVPVIFAGGSKTSDEDLLEKTRLCIQAGASGLIFGRNIWQRPLHDAVAMTEKIREVFRKERG